MEIIGVFVVLFFAMIEDVESRKIRNIWVALIFGLQFWMTLFTKEWFAPFQYLSKCILWMSLLAVLYVVGFLGAGDVKLCAVLMAGLNREDTIFFGLGCLTSGVVMAAWKLSHSKTELARLGLMWLFLRMSFYIKSVAFITALRQYRSEQKETIPLAVSMWAGYGFCLLKKGGII